jgi:hypothetical protein
MDRLRLPISMIICHHLDAGKRRPSGGAWLALDQDGFVVLEVNGKHVLIPNAHVDALVETQCRTPVVTGTLPPTPLQSITVMTPAQRAI